MSLKETVQEICHDLEKWLSYYLYLLYFTLLLDLLHREECGKVSHHKCHRYHSHMMESHMVMSYDKSHDECRKVVHRPCSSCISSAIKDMQSGSRVAWSGAELLWSGRELTTKVGEQPWPQLVCYVSICCSMCGCVFQEGGIVARSAGEEWYID